MLYAWVIAYTGVLVLLLTQGFGRMSYSVMLPSMKEGLLLSYTQVGLIGTANFVGYLSMAVAGGFIAVRFGPRRTIFISLLVMGVSLFLTGLSGSFESALLMRLITGLGRRLAPAALGFITLIFGIGQSLGPAVAGWIKDATGTFVWAFILSAAVSLVGAAGSMLLRKKA